MIVDLYLVLLVVVMVLHWVTNVLHVVRELVSDTVMHSRVWSKRDINAFKKEKKRGFLVLDSFYFSCCYVIRF